MLPNVAAVVANGVAPFELGASARCSAPPGTGPVRAFVLAAGLLDGRRATMVATVAPDASLLPGGRIGR